MPLNRHAFDKKLTPARQRLEMTKYLATKDIEVSDFEIKKGGTSYTIDTLTALSTRFPEYDLQWVISSKDFPLFHKWKKWNDIIQKFRLVVFPGSLHYKEEIISAMQNMNFIKLPPAITVIDNKDILFTNISSTDIRERVREGLPVTYMVPGEVARYIKEKGLYKK
jgi:nicotinate-nucleotide adenylyltransferase